MAAPEYLAVGHITRDLTNGGYTPGGTALYAAWAAQQLGLRAAVVTRVAPELLDHPLLAGLEVYNVPSEQSTSFENTYQGEARQQRLVSRGEPLRRSHIPRSWRAAGVIHLAPVAQELDPRLATAFPHSLVAATPQGWLRTWDSWGRVFPTSWHPDSALLNLFAVLICSQEDLAADLTAREYYARHCPLVVVTGGATGAQVYSDDVWRQVPALPCRVTHPTGAGDVYAAAFLISYAASRDPLQAARFAACYVTFLLEGRPLSALPGEAEAAARLAAYLARGEEA